MLCKLPILITAALAGLTAFAEESQPASEKPWADRIRAGEQHLRAGKSREALSELFEAQKIFPSNTLSPHLDHAGKALIHQLIAEAYFDQAMATEALNHASRALRLYRAAGDEFLAHQLVCLATVALAQQKTGDFTGAAISFQETLEILSRWKGSINDRTMEVWVQAVWFFQALGRTAESEELFKELTRRAQLSGGPGTVSLPLHGLASLYAAQKRYSEAEPLIRQSLELAPQLSAIQQSDIAARRLILAQILIGQKRLAEAEVEYAAALPVLRQRTDPPLAMLGTGLHYLAMLRAQQGRFDEAIGHMEEAGAILARWFTSNDPVILRHQREYVQVLRAAGRKREAKVMQKCLEAAREAWQAQNPGAHTIDARAFTNALQP